MIRVGQGFDVHQLVEGRPCIIGAWRFPTRKAAGPLRCGCAASRYFRRDPGRSGAGRHRKAFSRHGRDVQGRRQPEAAGAGVGAGQGARIPARQRRFHDYRAEAEDGAFYSPNGSIIARALEAEESQVNVKATTTEQLGFAGRGEGIAAQSVVCLLKNVLS